MFRVSKKREGLSFAVIGWFGCFLVACGGASAPEGAFRDGQGKNTSEAEIASAAEHEAVDLRLVGPTAAPALAPVRLAAGGLYAGRLSIRQGGVAELCGDSPGVDLAVDSDTELLRVSAEPACANVRVLFTVSEGLHRIVAKRSSGIQSVSDLAGKRVLVPVGSPSHYFLTRMAARANLGLGDGPDRIRVIDGTPDEKTFESEAAPDAVAIWEPGAQLVADDLGEDAVSLELDADGTRVYRELVNLHANLESLEDPAKQLEIARLVRALVAASRELEADSAKAIPMLSAASGVSAAVLAKSLAYQRFAGTLVGDVSSVLEELEPWSAALDGREPRTQAELDPLVNWTAYLTALWPEEAWD